MMQNLYQEILMDHYHHPRNRGPVELADFSSAKHNPSCGDTVQFEGKLNEGLVTKLGFQGKGCVISQGAASLLTERLLGKSIGEIVVLDKDFVIDMLGMQLGPIRLKCALLPLQALQEGISRAR